MDKGVKIPRMVLMASKDLDDIERRTRMIALRPRDEALINLLVEEFRKYGVDRTRLGMPIICLTNDDIELCTFDYIPGSDLNSLRIWNMHEETLTRFRSFPVMRIKNPGVIGRMNFVDGRHRFESVRVFMENGKSNNTEAYYASYYLVKIVFDFSPNASRFLSLQSSRKVLTNTACVTDMMNCLPQPGTQFSGLKELLKDETLCTKLLLPDKESVKKVLAVSFALFPSVKQLMARHRSTGMFDPVPLVRSRRGFCYFLTGLERYKIFSTKTTEGQRLFRGCSNRFKEQMQASVVATAVAACRIRLPWKPGNTLNKIAFTFVEEFSKSLSLSFEALDELQEERIVWRIVAMVIQGKMFKRTSTSEIEDLLQLVRSILTEVIIELNANLFTMWDLSLSDINAMDFGDKPKELDLNNGPKSTERETPQESGEPLHEEQGGIQGNESQDQLDIEPIETEGCSNNKKSVPPTVVHEENSQKTIDTSGSRADPVDVSDPHEVEVLPCPPQVSQHKDHISVERQSFTREKDAPSASQEDVREPVDQVQTAAGNSNGHACSPDISEKKQTKEDKPETSPNEARNLRRSARKTDISEKKQTKEDKPETSPNAARNLRRSARKTEVLHELVEGIGLEDENSEEASNDYPSKGEENGEVIIVEDDEIESKSFPTSANKNRRNVGRKRKRSQRRNRPDPKKPRLRTSQDVVTGVGEKKNDQKLKERRKKMQCLDKSWKFALQLTEWFNILGVHMARNDRVLFSSPEASDVPSVVFMDRNDFWEDGKSAMPALAECAQDGTQFSTIITVTDGLDPRTSQELVLEDIVYKRSHVFILNKKDWDLFLDPKVSPSTTAVVYQRSLSDSLSDEKHGNASIPNCVIWCHGDTERFLRDVFLTVVKERCNLLDFTCGNLFILKALCDDTVITERLARFYRAMPYTHGPEYKRCFQYLRDVCLAGCECEGHCVLQGLENAANEVNDNEDVPDAMKKMFRCPIGTQEEDIKGEVNIISHASLLLRRTKTGGKPLVGVSDEQLCRSSHDKNGEMFELGAFLSSEEHEKLMEMKSKSRITLLYPRGELVDAETASKEFSKFLSPFDLKTMYVAGITSTHLWYFMKNNSLGSLFNTIEKSESVCVYLEENYKKGSDFRVFFEEGFERFLRSETGFLRITLDVSRYKRYMQAEGESNRCNICGAVELFTSYGNEYYL